VGRRFYFFEYDICWAAIVEINASDQGNVKLTKNGQIPVDSARSLECPFDGYEQRRSESRLLSSIASGVDLMVVWPHSGHGNLRTAATFSLRSPFV
jgi:hypothetical protein